MIKVSAVSLNTTPFDVSGNVQKILSALETQECKSSDIVFFPELSISGYGCEDGFFAPRVWEKSFQSLLEISKFSFQNILLVGLPVFFDSFLYNCVAVLSNGAIWGIVPKQNLATTGVHYESRWFREWEPSRTEYYHFQNLKIPFGDLLFKTPEFQFGIEICEDSWVLNRPSRKNALGGADLIFSPGASHFAFGKHEIRKRIFQESSRSQQNAFLFTNLVGNESGRIIFDGGAIIACNGKISSLGERFTYSSFAILTDFINISELRSQRSREFRSNLELPNLVRVEIPYVAKKHETQTQNIPNSQSPADLESSTSAEALNRKHSNLSELTKYEEFLKAVPLGLFDYLRKSKSKGFTLSLSGGRDSYLCALLVFEMENQAKLQLGEHEFASLGFTNPILTTIYQETKNNSEITKKIAKQASIDFGSAHHELEIDALVDLNVSYLEKSLSKTLNWNENDLVLQNIQARVRSPISWLFANYHSHLLLSTGNRSEASVGYTTMDGDSSGSIAPLTGVSKTFINEFLQYIFENPNLEYSKLPSLKLLLETKPSAELKPVNQHQEDEKDLMEYSLLQFIEREYVVFGKSEAEILQLVSQNWKNLSKLEFDPKDVSEKVRKFCVLFHRNQWKRERLPPSFHLDEYGIDPKSSYRFPILSKD